MTACSGAWRQTRRRAWCSPRRQATIGALHLASGDQRVDIEGTVGIAADAESSLRVEATAVDIGDLLDLAGQDVDADGLLSVSATLGGTRERPLADGHLEITQGRVRNIDVQRVGGRVTFDGTLALVDLELVKDGFAKLTAKGVVPRTLIEGRSEEHVLPTAADRLDVAIVSTPIDLALAEGVSEFVTRLGGQAQMDVRLTGSGRDPHVEGAVFLTNGTFVVPMTGVTYKNLDAVLTFEEERVVISELGVETDNGDLLTVEGELGLSREQARTVNLRMQGKRLPRPRQPVRAARPRHRPHDFRDAARAGARGHARGVGRTARTRRNPAAGLRHGVRHTGRVPGHSHRAPARRHRAGPARRGRPPTPPRARRQHVRTRRARTPGSVRTPVPARRPRPAAPGTRASHPRRPTPAAAAPRSVFDATALNIQVRIPDNLTLRGQSIEAARASLGDLNATVGGDFRVAKTAGTPVVLLGAVNTVRGTYAYRGRRFDILRDGQILFRGNEEIDPRLDITAERVIQGVEARVRIQGTARAPELSLSSNPPLDEGDILALIVFNQPLNQLGTGQQNSLGQRAGGMAAGLVVSPLASALGSTLDLDQFEVETTDPTGRVNPAVVIGQQVTQDLFVRFRQQFGNQQVSQFLLEYRLASYMRLQGNIAEGDGLTASNRSLMQRIEQYGVDLVFFFSF